MAPNDDNEILKKWYLQYVKSLHCGNKFHLAEYQRLRVTKFEFENFINFRNLTLYECLDLKIHMCLQILNSFLHVIVKEKREMKRVDERR